MLLDVEHLRHGFGGVLAVDDVSFGVEAGETFGIIGPNGAGKTTLLNAISRVIRPMSGRVSLEGNDLAKLAPHEVRRIGLSRTFQGADYFLELTIREFLLLGLLPDMKLSSFASSLGLRAARRRDAKARESVDAVLEQHEMLDVAALRLHEVPYGVRKLLDVLRATMLQPKVLLLDEPTSGTSSAERERIADLIRDLGSQMTGAIVIVDHDIAFIGDVCERGIAMSAGGLLAEGTLAELLSEQAVIEAYMGS